MQGNGVVCMVNRYLSEIDRSDCVDVKQFMDVIGFVPKYPDASEAALLKKKSEEHGTGREQREWEIVTYKKSP